MPLPTICAHNNKSLDVRLVIIVVVFATCFVERACATRMITYGQGQVDIPKDHSSLPGILRFIYFLWNEPTFPLFPPNATPADVCSTNARYTRDYYWYLCRQAETTLRCEALLWHNLLRFEECVNYRNEHVPGASSHGIGFWSSQCQCHLGFQRLTRTNSFRSICSSAATSVEKPWVDLLSNMHTGIIKNMWTFAEEMLKIDGASPHHSQEIAEIVKEGPPPRVRFLSWEYYQCNKTHDPSISLDDPIDIYLGKYTFTSNDDKYPWNLYFTIPPVNNNPDTQPAAPGFAQFTPSRSSATRLFTMLEEDPRLVSTTTVVFVVASALLLVVDLVYLI